MNMDDEALRKNYSGLSDAEIARLSNYEAKELLPEAIPILKDEIKRRGLSDDLNVAIDIQLRGVTDEEVRELVDRVSHLPCPICGKKQNLLNAFLVRTVKPGLYVTVEKPLIMACPDCIISTAKTGLIETLIWGWWTFLGEISVGQAIWTNVKALNARKYMRPTPEFVEFIRSHAAVIKARINKINDVRDLLQIIS